MKVLWDNHMDSEAIGECEDDFRKSYPEFFF